MAKDSKTPFSNYKSAALNQLNYADATYTKAVFSGLIKSSPSTRSNVQTGSGPQKFFGRRRPLPQAAITSKEKEISHGRGRWQTR
jgi:hypothetical protein